MGAVQILLNGEGQTARTLLPAGIPEANYVKYDLAFTRSPLEPVNIENWEKGSQVLLPAGSWNWSLNITAYISDGEEGFLEAARGSTETPFTITNGGTSPVSVVMYPIIGEGTGTFAWDLSYPDEAVSVAITIQPLPSGTVETIFLETEGSEEISENPGSKSLAAGYYRVITSLSDGSRGKSRTDVMHIYKERTTTADFVFPTDYFAPLSVISSADSGPGTLRKAIEKAEAGDTILVELPPGSVIELQSGLPTITRNVTIEGNGVTLTRASSLNMSSTFHLLTTGRGYANEEVTIRRIHFKDGLAKNDGVKGGAIWNNGAQLTLESCIFSGNSCPRGGAVFNIPGTLTIKGCTFYGNTAVDSASGIFSISDTFTLTGNLFYGNITETGFGTIIFSQSVNASYNVVDVNFGTGSNTCGWEQGTGDTMITSLPVSPKSFRLLDGSGAADKLPSPLPADYPTVDFYGQPINGGGAAGAVQAATENGCYYFELSVNNKLAGSVTVNSEPDIDGLISPGSVTITAVPSSDTYRLGYWLVNGAKAVSTALNTLTISPSTHTFVQAVFNRMITVDSTDDSGSRTLRDALTNAQTGDIIDLNELSPGAVIELQSRLPQITNAINITIEGNGVTLTRSASWTDGDYEPQLLSINSMSAVVTIRRVHFKGGHAIGNYGTLTLESCVFSGNRYSGTAIGSGNTLTVRGCTFYGNTSGKGGAINFGAFGKILTLMGNIFYGNTAESYPVVDYDNRTVNASYNVVDIGFGTGNSNCGWDAGTGDTQAATLPVSPKTFKLLDGSGAAGKLPLLLPADYPTTDFYGQPISGGGAAGAVQASTQHGSGWYYLDLSVNDGQRGNVTVSPLPDDDGLLSASISLTATPSSDAYLLGYWLVNGTKTYSAPTSISNHTRIQAVFIQHLTVNRFDDTSDSNITPGTLRYALTNVQQDDLITFSGVTADTTVIELQGPLPQITKNMTIEGNGVTLTRASSWTSNNSQLFYINSNTVMVTVRRVHFKNGMAANYGGAIRNFGNLTLESCIFSGNQTTNSGAVGGAISSAGTLTIRACTFYGNTGYRGGAIDFSGSTLTLTGNVFYGNTATNDYPVVYATGTLSASYNVTDVFFGTGASQCGWVQGTGDTLVTALPVSPKTFKILYGSGSASIITTLPTSYPATDFYGQPIIAGGGAGAVQAVTASGYYYLDLADLTVNNSQRGSLTVSPLPDADGLVPASINLTATPSSAAYAVAHWLTDGVKTYSVPTTLTVHNTKVQAVFGMGVNNFTDTMGSATTPGTLRYAMTNAEDDDIIILSNVTAGTTSITLQSRLPNITKSLTIEGNGVTLISNSASDILLINSGVVTIRRVHFKNGRGKNDGGAIYHYYGKLILESCIFSDNSATGSETRGGAIYSSSSGNLIVRGCTFYNNKANYTTSGVSKGGGAIHRFDSGATLTGNLFYGNTNNTAFFAAGGYNSSYNVVDKAWGTGAGWINGTGDKTTLSDSDDLTISGVPFNTTTFVPVNDSVLRSTLPATMLADFPATDFYGTTRTFPGAPGAVATAP
jgi:hypothetical protein